MREISNSCNVSVKINQERGSFHRYLMFYYPLLFWNFIIKMIFINLFVCCKFLRLCDSRPVMMIGTLENIFEAQRQIMDRIRSAPRSAVEEYQKFK